MKSTRSALKNAIAQKRWYDKQKNSGIVYGLYIGGLLYVGSTTNSLAKRLQQHKSGTIASTRELAKSPEAVIFEIERPTAEAGLVEREQHWIDELKPELNKVAAKKRRPAPSGVYNGGIAFEGMFYPTKRALWRQRGSTLEGTFKSRLFHYPEDYAYALGVRSIPLKYNKELLNLIKQGDL